jgi:hypothetical protein
MPPRKSDQPRRSDVSVGRFVVDMNDEPTEQTPSAPVLATPAGPLSGGTTGTPVVPGTGEKKDKEKESSKDAVTIEVCNPSSVPPYFNV